MLNDSEFNSQFISNNFSNSNNSPETHEIMVDQFILDKKNICIQNSSNTNENNKESINNLNNFKDKSNYKSEGTPTENSIYFSNSIFEKEKEKIELFGKENYKNLINLKEKEKQLVEKYLEIMKKENNQFLLNITINFKDLRININNLYLKKNIFFFRQKEKFEVDCNSLIGRIEKYYRKKQKKNLIHENFEKEFNSQFFVFFLYFYVIKVNLKTKRFFFEVINNFDLDQTKNLLFEYKNMNEDNLINKYKDQLPKINRFILNVIHEETEFFKEFLEILIKKIEENTINNNN